MHEYEHYAGRLKEIEPQMGWCVLERPDGSVDIAEWAWIDGMFSVVVSTDILQHTREAYSTIFEQAAPYTGAYQTVWFQPIGVGHSWLYFSTQTASFSFRIVNPKQAIVSSGLQTWFPCIITISIPAAGQHDLLLLSPVPRIPSTCHTTTSISTSEYFFCRTFNLAVLASTSTEYLTSGIQNISISYVFKYSWNLTAIEHTYAT
jgi:hypothetical protein